MGISASRRLAWASSGRRQKLCLSDRIRGIGRSVVTPDVSLALRVGEIGFD